MTVNEMRVNPEAFDREYEKLMTFIADQGEESPEQLVGDVMRQLGLIDKPLSFEARERLIDEIPW